MRETTKRLILRSLVANDAKILLDYQERNKDFFREWEPKREEKFYSLEQMSNIIVKNDKEYLEKTFFGLYLFNKEDEERIIGNISVTNIAYGVFQSCFLGFKLDKDEINQGKITEALKIVISIIFDEYKLHRIEANIMPKNVRSRRVVEKLGFTEEGLSKKYLRINGKWEDHLHYALLNEVVE